MTVVNEKIASGDVCLALTRWGDPAKPTIVLVHGYPDNSLVWHPIAERLATGFHVVAYDVRGAGQSDRPKGMAAYRLASLMQDFVAVIDHVSPHAPVHLVAHDWGSIQSWESVTEPALAGRIASFTSCSGPCLDHIGHAVRQRLRHPTVRGTGQLLLQGVKSWYINLLHLPFLPALMWRLGLGRAWPTVLLWLEGVRVERSPTQAADGAGGAMLYRANILPRLWSPRKRHAHAPVLVLVPRRDWFVSPWLTEDLGRWVSDLQRQQYNAGHWMPLSQPREMVDAVRAFIARVDGYRALPGEPVTAQAGAPRS